MSEYTPGPWRVEDGTRIMPPDNATQLPIAKMGKLQHESKIEPNARLIAAAPELLEALLEIKRLIDEYAIVRRDGRLMGTGEAVSVGFVFERADRAIAKAKGEQ